MIHLPTAEVEGKLFSLPQMVSPVDELSQYQAVATAAAAAAVVVVVSSVSYRSTQFEVSAKHLSVEPPRGWTTTAAAAVLLIHLSLVEV